MGLGREMKRKGKKKEREREGREQEMLGKVRSGKGS